MPKTTRIDPNSKGRRAKKLAGLKDKQPKTVAALWAIVRDVLEALNG